MTPHGVADDYDWDETYDEYLRLRLRRLRDIDELDDRYSPVPAPPSRGYRTEFTEMNQGWYWHLYRYDKRVNGGLSATRDGAGSAARSATAAHLYSSY